MSILALDFGGTRIRAGWFSDDLTLLNREEALTDSARSAPLVLQSIVEVARAAAQGRSPSVIGIAAPGPLDAEHGVIHHAFTLPGWGPTPLADLLSQAFAGVPAFMQNDANLAALAEYHLGAGQGCDPMLYLTISTGIGGGAVIGGKLFAGWRGLAIEPGHLRFTLPDGSIRRLEELCSGTGIASVAQTRLAASNTPSSLRSLSNVDARAVGAAATAGDEFAQGLIAEAGRWLGLGLVDLLHLFNPRAIVCGGSVTQLGERLFAPARAVIHEQVLHPDFYADDAIRTAALGDDVCLYGAAYYADQRSHR